jgi:hypothetical protein
MSMAADDHNATLRAIELLGQEVRPLVRPT